VTAFKTGCKWRVLIASYENIRKHCELLRGSIDLLVCDEGHRLKASQLNSTMKALLDLGCPRRIICTGTPVQNNLREFDATFSAACNSPNIHALEQFLKATA
jgi:SNF2 family DNA or RNA helicase